MAAPLAAKAVIAAGNSVGWKRIAKIALVTMLLIGLIPGIVIAAVIYPAVVVLAAPSIGVGGGGGNGDWVVPVEGVMTDSFGPREPFCSDWGCTSNFHKGQDWGAACGTPVVAASSGVVIRVGEYGGWGQSITIDHGDGLTTQYNHLQDYLAKEGDRVAPRTPIGLVGETGISGGCHLDFMVITSAGYIDPVAFLRTRGINL